MSPDGPPAPGPDVPSSARLHNALGGGWNCTPADEAKVAELEEICPPVRQMGADSRLFTVRAVSWAAAEQGISQFIDLGAGLPPGASVHEMAGAVRPGARVAYVDHDEEAAISWPTRRPARASRSSMRTCATRQRSCRIRGC